MRLRELLTEKQTSVDQLEKDLKQPHSYDAIDHMMQTIAREHGITGKQLHDLFVKRHGATPDDWIKQLAENFADGKKPGRKGQAKRSGVDCKQSVTQLRKVAANSSGERQRMAHWCANMKSGRAKNESELAEGLMVDVPNEDWLQDKIDYAKSKSPTRHGLPYMGSTTAYVRPNIRVPMTILKRLRGMRNEQDNVRKEDLIAIMKIMKDTGKLPLLDHGEEYVPFINVAYDGTAWINEGNHRIMAALALGWSDLPVQISYFDGGERVESGLMYPGKIGLGAQTESEIEEGWRDTIANLAIAGGVAAGGMGGMVAKQAAQDYFKEPAATTAAAAPQAKNIAAPNSFAQAKAAPAAPAAIKSEPKNVNVQAVTNNPMEAVLLKVARSAGLQGAELAAFMAQCAHETLDFKRLTEFGGSLDFRKYDPKYAPKKARALGNKQVGDGAKYKGRGFIQITGRYNYKRAGEALGIPLEKQPELAADPAIAAKVAVWFWQHRVQPNVDNFKDTTSVTKQINPGMRGLADRKENFADYMQVAMK